jgi:hypothetical protein
LTNCDLRETSEPSAVKSLSPEIHREDRPLIWDGAHLQTAFVKIHNLAGDGILLIVENILDKKMKNL